MDSDSKITTDHAEIKRWVEKRNGHPASVKNTGQGKQDAGLLRIDFPGYSGKDSLEKITWDEFFKKFDESNLAFLYQENLKDGKESRFFKFVDRNSTKTE
jgi:hypothetical protein